MQFNDEQISEVCAAYFGEAKQNMIARMKLNMIMSDVGWGLWAAIQAKISTIEFDFWGWATERWDRADFPHIGLGYLSAVLRAAGHASDSIAADRDFLAQGPSGTIWDGFLSREDQSAPEAILAKDGALRLQSKGTVWDGGKPLGAFLFKLVSGDFAAQVRVADYAGLSTRRVPGNNDGGLMVRLPKVEDGGPGEDLVQLNFFPIWK